MSAAGHPKVYLAGFDVFREDAVELGEYLKRLCRAQGLEGLYPFDNEVPRRPGGRRAGGADLSAQPGDDPRR